jgi:hypothetical protein
VSGEDGAEVAKRERQDETVYAELPVGAGVGLVGVGVEVGVAVGSEGMAGEEDVVESLRVSKVTQTAMTVEPMMMATMTRMIWRTLPKD